MYREDETAEAGLARMLLSPGLADVVRHSRGDALTVYDDSSYDRFIARLALNLRDYFLVASSVMPDRPSPTQMISAEYARIAA